MIKGEVNKEERPETSRTKRFNLAAIEGPSPWDGYVSSLP